MTQRPCRSCSEHQPRLGQQHASAEARACTQVLQAPHQVVSFDSASATPKVISAPPRDIRTAKKITAYRMRSLVCTPSSQIRIGFVCQLQQQILGASQRHSLPNDIYIYQVPLTLGSAKP